MGAPIVVAMRSTWGLAFRSALHDALLTTWRGYWLIRLGFALMMLAGGQWSWRFMCRASGQTLNTVDVALILLPVLWFLYPFARIPVAGVLTVTLHDEGLSLESGRSSLSAAWPAVRGVRRTPWDLVIVLDGTSVSVPLALLPAAAVDSVVARFRAAARAAPPGRTDGTTASPAPYRTPHDRPPAFDDEEASAREWVAPAQYPDRVLAFPSATDHVLALVALKRSAVFLPAVLLVLGACLVLLGTVGGSDRVNEVVPFVNVGVVVALIGVASFVIDFSPALFALGDRSVRERSAGVLYALGPGGLYLRTQSFERRESWGSVFVVRAGTKRVAVFTASLVHVVPVSAFEDEAAHARFVSTLERECAARPRNVYT